MWTQMFLKIFSSEDADCNIPRLILPVSSWWQLKTQKVLKFLSGASVLFVRYGSY